MAMLDHWRPPNLACSQEAIPSTAPTPLASAAAAFAAEPEAARHFLSHGASVRDESLHMETHAAWAALCLNLLNLDETLNKE